MGKYIGRPSVVGFMLHGIGFNSRIVHVGFLVYTVAQEEIDFILPAVIPPVHHTGMSYVLATESHLKWQYQGTQTPLSPANKTGYRFVERNGVVVTRGNWNSA
jgi:hypothetical protein